MNQHFNFDGKDVRVIIREGEPWFVGKDVCDILGTRTKDLPTIRKTGAYMTDETLAKVTQDPAKMDELTDQLSKI